MPSIEPIDRYPNTSLVATLPNWDEIDNVSPPQLQCERKKNNSIPKQPIEPKEQEEIIHVHNILHFTENEIKQLSQDVNSHETAQLSKHMAQINSNFEPSNSHLVTKACPTHQQQITYQPRKMRRSQHHNLEDCHLIPIFSQS
jgi:hypothetical protein